MSRKSLEVKGATASISPAARALIEERAKVSARRPSRIPRYPDPVSSPLSFGQQWLRCSVGADYPQSVLADGPLGYWRLQEASGTTAVDSSGNGRPGVYQGGVVLGQAGAIAGSSAAAFDGVDDQVVVSTDTGGLSPARVTVEAWVKSTTASWSTYGFVVSKRDSYVLHPLAGSKTMEFRIFSGSNEVTASWTAPAGFDLTPGCRRMPRVAPVLVLSAARSRVRPRSATRRSLRMSARRCACA